MQANRDWKVKCVVTSIAPLKTIAKNNNQVNVFEFNIKDVSGKEMKCISYRELAIKHSSIIELNQYYIIEKGNARIVQNNNSKYASCNNQYELRLGDATKILAVNNDGTITTDIKYVSISDVSFHIVRSLIKNIVILFIIVNT